MLFGKKNPEGRTLLILDIESGSVGGGLVRLTLGEAPKLFAETRMNTKILPTRDGVSLLRHVGEDIQHVLAHIAGVASRLRNASTERDVQDIGNVSRAAIFFGAPWGIPNIGAGAPTFVESLAERTRRGVAEIFDTIPQNIQTAASAAFTGMRQMLPHDGSYILCIVNAELTEILLVAEGEVIGYATVPRGRHTAVRTLRAHANISDHEAFSALRLARSGNSASPYSEALMLLSNEYGDAVADGVARLLVQSPAAVSRVYVMTHGGESKGGSEWFAQSLAANERMGELLPQGSVRALSAQHAMPYLSAHAETPDLMLMLQGISVAGWI